MKRPLFVIGCSFACTTWLAFFFGPGAPLLLSGALTVTALLVHLLKKDRFRAGAVVLLSAAVALAAYALYDLRTVAPYDAVDGAVIEVHAVVLEKSFSGNVATYTVKADFPGYPELPQGQTILLRSYGGELSHGIGDGIRCLVRVKLPRDTASPHYYRSRGIRMIGTVRGQVHLSASAPRALEVPLMRLRERMQDNLYENLSPGSADVLGAVVLGLQSDVDADVYTAVNRAGTSHLLAVSGLHLSILSACLLSVLSRLRTPRRLNYAVVIAASFLFAVLVGFSASILRAFLMTGMALVAQMISRRSDSRNSLGFALIVICIIAPHWTLGRGMWLSAMSALGIIVLWPRAQELLGRIIGEGGGLRRRFLQAMLGAFAVSICAYAFSLPVLIFSYGWFSLVAPLTNMLIAPFVPVLIIGGILCASLPLGGVFSLIAAATDLCASLVVGISQIFAALPFATVSLDEFYLLILCAGIVAGVVALAILRADKKAVRYALTLCLLCYSMGSLAFTGANRGYVELITLDGCDTAILLRQDQAVLLGTPDRYSVGRLTRYLDFRGVRSVSAVIATDCPDQIDSGLLRIADLYGIDCVIGPDDVYNLAVLELALPDSAVLSGGYATTGVLDAAVIRTDASSADFEVRIGADTIFKTDAPYAIMEEWETGGIHIFAGGELSLPRGRAPQVEPVGGYLFGETRVLIPTE